MFGLDSGQHAGSAGKRGLTILRKVVLTFGAIVGVALILETLGLSIFEVVGL